MNTVKHVNEFKFEFVLNRKGQNATLAKGNEMISANDRMHYMVKMKITRHLRELSRYQLLSEPVRFNNAFSPENPCTVEISVCPPTRKRMDPPNWYPTVKALIDGMTDAHLWTDDNKDVIKAMTFRTGKKTDDKKYHLIFKVKGEK